MRPKGSSSTTRTRSRLTSDCRNGTADMQGLAKNNNPWVDGPFPSAPILAPRRTGWLPSCSRGEGEGVIIARDRATVDLRRKTLEAASTPRVAIFPRSRTSNRCAHLERKHRLERKYCCIDVIECWSHAQKSAAAHYLLTDRDLQHSPRVGAFFDFVTAEIKAFRTMLSGQEQ